MSLRKKKISKSCGYWLWANFEIPNIKKASVIQDISKLKSISKNDKLSVYSKKKLVIYDELRNKWFLSWKYYSIVKTRVGCQVHVTCKQISGLFLIAYYDFHILNSQIVHHVNYLLASSSGEINLLLLIFLLFRLIALLIFYILPHCP